MKKKIDVDINLSPIEVADSIWNDFNSDEQAILLSRLASVHDNERAEVERQFLWIAKAFKEKYSYAIPRVVAMLESLTDWIRGEKEWKGDDSSDR